jgi:hypothetical protein
MFEVSFSGDCGSDGTNYCGTDIVAINGVGSGHCMHIQTNVPDQQDEQKNKGELLDKAQHWALMFGRAQRQQFVIKY